jgi:hypothetical protein
MRSGERGIPLEARLGLMGITWAALDLGSVYLKGPAWRAGLTAGDLVDIAATYTLVALCAWVASGLLGRPGGGSAAARPRGWIAAILSLSAITFVLGHGVHLAANSINDMISHAGLGDPTGLVDWWDEHVGHDLIDAGSLGLCVGLTSLERSVPQTPWILGAGGGARIFFLLGALSYGFIYFASSVEGQTVIFLLPFAGLYLLWALLSGHGGARRRTGGGGTTVRSFYAVAFVVAGALFAIWGIWHRGFPEFSSVGMIP